MYARPFGMRGTRECLYEINSGISIYEVVNGDYVIEYPDVNSEQRKRVLCQDVDSLILTLLDVVGGRDTETRRSFIQKHYGYRHKNRGV